MTTFPSGVTWAQRLALLALSMLCSLPFLVPLHTQPIATFYNEVLAVLCGLFCLPALCDSRGLLVPRIILAPLLVLLAIALQYFWLPEGLRSGAVLAILALIWACGLMLVAARLVRDLGLQSLAHWLASAIVLAAVLNAMSTILFHAGVRGHVTWLFLTPDLRGNLAQVNHLADVLWLGIASVLYMWQRTERATWRWMFALAPLMVASALVGARAPYAYALWILCVAWLSGNRRMLRATVLLAVGYVLLTLLSHALPMSSVNASDSVARLASAAHFGTGGQIRLGLMKVAADIALAHPLLGAGWGSFAWVSYQLVVPGLDWQGTGEHAHQLFFQLAAEMGLLVPLLVAALLGLWLRSVWPQRQNVSTAWAVSVAGTLLLHAQVEYPLWYVHFLGVCCVLLAISDGVVYALPQWQFKPLSISVLLLAGAYMLASLGYDYLRLERWVFLDVLRGSQRVTTTDYYRVLGEWHKGSLLKPQIEHVLAAVMDPVPDHVEDKRMICELALVSEPQAPSVFTCALLDELAGDKQKAEQRWRTAITVFRAELPAYLARIEQRLPLDVQDRLQRLVLMAKVELAQSEQEKVGLDKDKLNR